MNEKEKKLKSLGEKIEKLRKKISDANPVGIVIRNDYDELRYLESLVRHITNNT